MPLPDVRRLLSAAKCQGRERGYRKYKRARDYLIISLLFYTGMRISEAVGLDPVGLSPKTTRKTYEAWLVKFYPERQIEVFMRQGHTSATSLKHYLNFPFLDADKALMEPWVAGVF